MVQLVKNWFQRYFADTELAILWMFLLFVIVAFALVGKILAPVLVGIVIAYLLQWPVALLQRIRVPHFLAVIIVYLLFIGLFALAVLGLLPLLWQQLTNLVSELPNMVAHGQAILMHLPERYPSFVSADQIQQVLTESKSDLSRFGQFVLSAIVSSIPNIIAAAIYFVLVPILVYFFLMDRAKILNWASQYLPARRRLISQVWNEVYAQTGNYVRGKVLEMLIVWIVTYIAFWFMGLQYAMLLSVLVGVSVIIPYIGAVLVTIPVLVIAFLQWGWSNEFAYLVVIYAVIVALDANVLVPLLFSEVVNLHPVAIIVAVLFFGGLWGFWGVFFAIPLATLVKAVLNAVSTKA